MVYGYDVAEVAGSGLYRIKPPAPAGAWAHGSQIVLHLKGSEPPPDPPGGDLAREEVIGWRDSLKAAYPGDVMSRGPALAR